MFDFSWQNILHSNTLNFVILVVILYWVLAPKVKAAVENCDKRTTDTVNESIETRQQAIKNLEDSKVDYARTPEEVESINKTATNTLSALEKKAEEDTEIAKKLISDNAEKAVKNEASRITSTLTKETAENSINSSIEEIKRRLENDESLHDRLIEQAINDLETA